MAEERQPNLPDPEALRPFAPIPADAPLDDLAREVVLQALNRRPAIDAAGAVIEQPRLYIAALGKRNDNSTFNNYWRRKLWHEYSAATIATFGWTENFVWQL
jgi:hypothetical protein